MPLSFLAIGLGAAIGAWLRWGLGLWLNPLNTTFPLGTLVANLVGGFGIGVALAWFAQQSGISPEWRLFAITGLLGGLTTFSTFSGEVVELVGRQQYAWAIASTGAHVIGSLTMTALGLLLCRAVLRVMAGA